MADSNDDIVVFQNSAGEEISNDPRWHAKRVLEANGGTDPNTEKDDIIAQLQAQLEEMQAKGLAPKGAGDDDEIETEAEQDLDEAGHRTYKELQAKELADLVKTREITIEGKKTAGAARAALIADDTAKREAASE